MKNAKGELLLSILSAIGEGVISTSEVVLTILESGYGASYSTMERNLRERRESKLANHIAELKLEKQKIYSTLNRLKKNGFLDVVDQNWKITNSGKNKLAKLIKTNNNRLPSANYKKEASNNVKIITYDVPESRKRERDWLRLSLANLGFKMMHKSVWIGKVKIPEDFLDDIKILKLSDFVEILSITKSGNIRKLD